MCYQPQTVAWKEADTDHTQPKEAHTLRVTQVAAGAPESTCLLNPMPRVPPKPLQPISVLKLPSSSLSAT